MDSYKYLGVWLDSKLDWSKHTSNLYGKVQSRMYFLRKLQSFNICSKLLCMFYQSVIAKSSKSFMAAGTSLGGAEVLVRDSVHVDEVGLNQGRAKAHFNIVKVSQEIQNF
ncbi:unnamed protein product [Menidia menidia]|uniref:(Atlantic silverside) hypothetical protein n=1 Tax=Menidia menidia TaxID=238744 RepID=A0A8S4BPN3_9TELE|nr:unnamed protein product [Menidia menidia]